MTVPLLGSTTGAAGAVASTTICVGGEVLPAGSVATTVTGVPSGNGVSGVTDQLPLGSVTVVKSGSPSPSTSTSTVEPGSAVPPMTVPLLGSTTGAAGAVASTTAVAGPETLPVGSVAVAVIVAPSAMGVPGVTDQRPSAPATTVKSGVPSPLTSILTVEPASADPLMTVPFEGSITGAAGAVESTTARPGPEVLPAASVAVAVTAVPSASRVGGVTVQLPLAPATTVKSAAPSPLISIRTVAPGSAEPLMVVPLVGLTTGAAGATASTTP